MKARAVWLPLTLALSCGGLRASTVPLGGSREREATEPARSAAPAVASAALPERQGAADEAPELAGSIDEAPVAVATASAPTPQPASAALSGSGAPFEPKPYVAGQKWTRILELEGQLKGEAAPALVMNIASHQEARFEIMAVSAGAIDKLRIEYVSYVSKMTLMGNTQESPEDVSGKAYVITFPQGKPDVKTSSGASPTKKELETVNDDAREPLEAVKAFQELAKLAARGAGDFTSAGALSLAGGEDDDTKVASAKASLKRVTARSSAEIDLSYTLTSFASEGAVVETKLSGIAIVLDAPARYQSFSLSGPLELRSSDGSGPSGRGTTKVTLSYRY